MKTNYLNELKSYLDLYQMDVTEKQDILDDYSEMYESWESQGFSEEEVEAIGLDANMFPLIAVNFPSFMDGRGFSIGRLLKERYGFTGQLRAIGNAIPDQLFYLKRCGFTSFDLKDGTDLEAACQSLNDFDVSYQSAYDQPEALFRRN